MRRILPRAAVLLLLVAAPVAAGAQAARPVVEGLDVASGGEAPRAVRVDAPPVEPGAVSTAAVVLPSPPRRAQREARYTIVPSPGVRVFGELSGKVLLEPGEPAVLPVTYSVPRGRGAGAMVIAEVVVEWSDGTSWRASLQAEVRTRRLLRAVLRAAEPTVAPGGRTMLHYVVQNLGNAADTVEMRWDAGGGWQVATPAVPLVIGPGAEASGSVAVRAPETASSGEVRVVQLAAAGRGHVAHASAVLRVESAAATRTRLELPTQIFVGGTAADPEQLTMSVNAGGMIASGTELNVAYRRNPLGSVSPAFVRQLTGPEMRIDLRRTDWTAAVGDVWSAESALLGSALQGRGADLRWKSRDLFVEGFAARLQGTTRDGWTMHGAVGGKTPIGTLGVSFSQLEQRARLGGGASLAQGAGVNYLFRPAASPHRLRAQAGVLRLRSALGTEAVGPALDASYSFSSDRASLNADLRHTPGVLDAGEVLPSRAFLGGSVRVVGGASVVGWGSVTTLSPLDGGVSRSEAGAAGVSLGGAGARVDLLGSVQRNEGAGLPGGPSRRETVVANAAVPLGGVTLDGTAEVGRIQAAGAARELRALRGGVRWFGATGWAWSGVSYSEGEFEAAVLRADLNGSVRRGRAELEGGAGVTLHDRRGLAESGTFWSGLSWDVSRALVVVGGVAYHPGSSPSPWQLSLGVRRRLDVPLPLRRPAVVEGVVFEDANGNGRRDRDEPGVAGVGLSLGYLRATTAVDGGFAFTDESARGQSLHVDAASLRVGVIVPPSARLRSQGRVEVPLVRTAALTLVLFVDADGNGERGEAELPSEGAVTVTLTAADGRARDAAPGADGTVRMDALLPGSYTLTVRMLVPGTARERREERTLKLEPGEDARHEVPLPRAQREIRFSRPAGSQ